MRNTCWKVHTVGSQPRIKNIWQSLQTSGHKEQLAPEPESGRTRCSAECLKKLEYTRLTSMVSSHIIDMIEHQLLSASTADGSNRSAQFLPSFFDLHSVGCSHVIMFGNPSFSTVLEIRTLSQRIGPTWTLPAAYLQAQSQIMTRFVESRPRVWSRKKAKERTVTWQLHTTSSLPPNGLAWTRHAILSSTPCVTGLGLGLT